MHEPANASGTGTRRAAVLALAAVLVSALSVLPLEGAAAGDARPLGDSRMLASLPPSPGFPEGLTVVGRRAFVGAPAQNGHFGAAPVYEVDLRTGELSATHLIDDADPNLEHALVGMAADGDGRIYVLDTQRGVVRLDPSTGEHEVYAGPVPDLPSCTPVRTHPCSPTATDRPPLPNDILFTPDGTALVTDSFQATIWQVPPGGAAVKIWYQDERFDTPFGLNGIRLTPDRTRVLVNVFQPGEIVSLPLVEAPSPDDLEMFADVRGEGPDNLAFGRSGLLYVTLVSRDAVVALDANGEEVHRFHGPAHDPDGDVPWDAPASVAFDTPARSLVVVNHALVRGLADPSRFIVFDVFVDDRPDPLELPQLP